MAQLEGISLKRTISRSLCCVLASSLLCGCQNTIESVRPEINRYGDVVTDGQLVSHISEYLTSDTLQRDDIIQGGGSSLDVEDIIQNTFPETEREYVAASSYSDYLSNEIYSSVFRELSNAGVDMSKIYFRVFHMGYNYVDGSTEKITSAPAHNSQIVGSVRNVGGHVLTDYAVKWLNPYNDNGAYLTIMKNNYFDYLNELWETDDYTVLGYPSKLQAMWRNPRLNATTQAEFKQAIANSVVGTVADLKLAMNRGVNNIIRINLNVVTDNTVPYIDCMLKQDVDLLFTAYNQCQSRSAAPVTSFAYDDCTILKSYTDGYMRTLVVIGCDKDNKLSDILGSSYNDIFVIIGDMAMCTDTSRVTSIVGPHVKILSRGVRGID